MATKINDWVTLKTTADKLQKELNEMEENGFDVNHVIFQGGRDWLIVGSRPASNDPIPDAYADRAGSPKSSARTVQVP